MTVRLVQIGLGGWGRNWVEELTRDTPGVEPVVWTNLDLRDCWQLRNVAEEPRNF